MTAKQESKLKMLLTLRNYLMSNPAVTAKLPNFDEFMAALDAAIVQIQANSELQQFNSKGSTEQKSQLRDDLMTLTMDASARMQAYAKYAHNALLLNETKLTLTDLKHASGLQLVDISNALYTSIDANIDNVFVYGLTSDSQYIFRQSIDVYRQSIPQSRQNQLKSKENTLLEAQAFAAADDAVSNIDTLVEIVRLEENLFYTGYKNARKVIDSGTGSLQVMGTVMDATTSKGIPGAILRFCLQGSSEVVLEKETATKGGFNVKTLSEGIYTITVIKVGFQTKTVQATVRWEELCTLDVKLDKIEVS